MTVLHVRAPGALTTVQDAGRPGLGAFGVGRSGAADLPALRAANRLVGNDPGAAGLEVTAGGLTLSAQDRAIIAVTGACAPVLLGRGGDAPRPAGSHTRLVLSAGDTVTIGAPTAGLRSYLAVRGGVEAEPVLGSRAYDTHAGLGPRPLRTGDRITAGRARHPLPAIDALPPPYRAPGPVALAVWPGPRADWFTPAARELLLAQHWTATAAMDRVGVRLSGPRTLERVWSGELPSEGMVTGAVQVPGDGTPVIFLADHPVTGGYPVIAVLTPAAVARAAQLTPGAPVRFVPARRRGVS